MATWTKRGGGEQGPPTWEATFEVGKHAFKVRVFIFYKEWVVETAGIVCMFEKIGFGGYTKRLAAQTEALRLVAQRCREIADAAEGKS